jgi:hypothetical protein
MSIINHYRLRGFVMSRETTANWASRITNKTLDDCEFWAIQNVIQAKVQRWLQAG